MKTDIQIILEEKLGPQNWQPCKGGITASTFISDNYICQCRHRSGLAKLEALSEWAEPLRDKNPLFELTKFNLVAVEDDLFWHWTRRIGDDTSRTAFASMPEWKKFKLFLSAMTRTMIDLDEFYQDNPIRSSKLLMPPINSGTAVRNSSSELIGPLAKAIGFEIDKIKNAPEAAPKTRAIFSHGDLNVRNMVPESKTGALAIDWEMVGIHPLGSELGHMFTRHLIKAESIQEWEERLNFFLPEMISIGEMTETEAFAMLYWGTLADACVLHSAEVEVDKDLLLEGLKLFV